MPTADPMLQDVIREGVDRIVVTDVMPTPAVPSRNVALTVDDAVERAMEAATPNIRTMELMRRNVVRQIQRVREAVNMAITVLSIDDRYQELAREDEIWGGIRDEDDNYVIGPDGRILHDLLHPQLRMELAMFQAMGYEELRYADRLALEVLRDLGYAQFNINVTLIDHNIDIMKRGIEFAVYAQYAGIAQMQGALELQRAALENTARTLEIARRRYELGHAPRVEVDAVQATFERAELEIARSERSLRSLVTSFNRTIGENLDTTYRDFDLSLLAPAETVPSLEYYMEKALQERSEALIAAERMRIAEAEADHFRAVYRGERTYERFVRVQAAEEAALNYELARNSVEADVRRAYRQLLTLRGTLPVNERQIGIARENFERVQRMYELGTVTASVVNTANLGVMQAELMLANNKINIWTQQKRLEIITGIGPGNLR